MTGRRLSTAFALGSLLAGLAAGCSNSAEQVPPNQAGGSKGPQGDVAVCGESLAGYQLVMDDFALALAKPPGDPTELPLTAYRLLGVYEPILSKNLPLARDEALKKALTAELAAVTAIREKVNTLRSRSRLSDITPSPEWDGLGKELSAVCARIAPTTG
ncbi:hypothetical protein [Rhizocola hellebori]|nr:hypothetical protein [Rhizocola hellebori]